MIKNALNLLSMKNLVLFGLAAVVLFLGTDVVFFHGGEPIATALTGSDLHEFYMRLWVFGFGVLIYISLSQIVKRKKLEDDLKSSKSHFETAFSTSPDSININRLNDGLYLDINQGFTNLTGYTREDVIGRSSMEIGIWNDPADRQRLVEGLKSYGEVANLEADFRRKDGTLTTALMSASVVMIDNEPHILSVTRDISERKKAELELYKTKEMEKQRAKDLRTILDAIPALVWVAEDPRCEVIRGNKLAAETLGLAEDENMSMSVPEVCGKVSFEVMRKGLLLKPDEMPVQRAAKGEQIRDYEFEFAFPGGEKKYLLGNATPLMDSDGKIKGAVAAFVDVSAKEKTLSEKRQLEAQLAQAQKVEAIGRLAGGVAHDFNNMLSVIIGNAELALGRPSLDETVKGNLIEIEEAAERSAAITRQLLAFARKQVRSPKVIDINRAIDNILKMVTRLIGEDIDLTWKPSCEGCNVFIDPSQLDQVLINLATNARYAIKEKGKIIIETSLAELDDDFCVTRQEMAPGPYVILSFSDNGAGIPKESLSRIFEPFYTTKSTGHGTGLGLSTVYGIVTQNRGRIEVESSQGSGTVFRIFFPLQTQDAEETAPSTPNHQAQGSGTILLVEDEPSILRLASRILRNRGYYVMEAGDPGAAIAISDTFNGRIDLLLTDVIMPGMNGKVLSEVLTPRRPEMKTLFLSGYSAEFIADRGALEDSINYLSKPFTSKELLAKISDLLAGD